MRFAAFFLGVLLAASACVVEDKPIADAGLDGGADGGGDASTCGGCPAEMPVCIEDEARCVECTVADDAYCEDRAQVCDEENNVCQDCITEDGCCVDDETCSAAEASVCDLDTNTCTECQTDTDCDGVDGLDPTGNACDDGVCVECTPASEADTCANNRSCNPATNECTDTEVGSLEVCDPCVADSECGEDGVASEAFRCVPMTYEGSRFPDEDTGFCLKTTDGGCVRPYAVTLSDRTSLSGPESRSDYCGIEEALTTCDAVIALIADDRCPGGADEECATGGVCRDVGSLPNRCTYLCGLAAQCPEDAPADTCGSSGSGGEDYCGGG
jgi:hypothetical protein